MFRGEFGNVRKGLWQVLVGNTLFTIAIKTIYLILSLIRYQNIAYLAVRRATIQVRVLLRKNLFCYGNWTLSYSLLTLIKLDACNLCWSVYTTHTPSPRPHPPPHPATPTPIPSDCVTWHLNVPHLSGRLECSAFMAFEVECYLLWPWHVHNMSWRFCSLHWRPSWLSCINEYLAIDSGGNVSDLVVARNCCMSRMRPGEAELVSEWTGLPGRSKV